MDLEKYGAQIFEMGKAVAEAINAGQGGDFFKFQPNPDQVDGAREADAVPRLFGFSPSWARRLSLLAFVCLLFGFGIVQTPPFKERRGLPPIRL